LVSAKFWIDAALRLDSEASQARAMAALLHLFRDEEAEAVAIARKLANPSSLNRWGSREIALRIVAASEIATGDHEESVGSYLTLYPELADGRLPTEWLTLEPYPFHESLVVTLDLASLYLHAGNEAKARALLSLVESELRHWPRTALWRFGIADVELHALRGEKEEALAALQEHVETGMREMWRWQVLYNPNLDSIRATPEFQAMVAEIEADMAEQLARVREMQRSGELEPIPEVSATTQ
jgi:hypothetical protein